MLETVRAYGLDRLAEAGEDTRARDAVARYYLDLAETADPLLRTGTQARWFRVLTAEQDNVNAAIRWAIARGDADTALRFVRALGYYWVQPGHGEADAICREVLTMTTPPLTMQLVEARVICALLAAGWNWNIDLIREPLTEALTALKRFGGDYGSLHPLVAMAEPMLMQYDGAAGQAQEQFERYIASSDPWLQAAGKVYLATYAVSLGRLEHAEDHCRVGLAEFRALGEQWGVAMALTQLAEFTELRADHAASIAAITEAAAIGRELGVWGDLTYIEARLAVLLARGGDPARASEEIAQVQRAMEARGDHVDTDRWVAFMRAELAWLDGDYAEAARCCEVVLTTIAPNQARWWQSLRAQVKARLALAVRKGGDQERCHALLNEALDAAATWWEHPALAVVLDACAAYLVSRARQGDPERAARLLGAAHAIRGAFDESSLDAPPAREAARTTLRPPAFDAAYESTSALTYDQAIALARESLSAA
jgi:hypothetical protein